MAKKKNIIKRFFTHPILVNLLIMLGIFLVLVFITLFALDIFTKHNETVTVPPVKDLQVEDALGILRARDLNCEVVDSIFKSGGVPGAILDQIPEANSKVKRDRTVFLVIQSKMQPLVGVPSLKDYSQRQAEAQLNALGFENIRTMQVISQYKGLVIEVTYKGQKLEPGQKIPKGSPLTMVVGAGGGAAPSEQASNNADTSGEEKPLDAENSFFE